VTILSTYAVRLELQLGLLHTLEVKGFPVSRVWHVVWARERILGAAAHAFHQHLLTQDWRRDLTVALSSE
jgi:DNA-binding transcriptional LysR family regulator